MYSPFYLAIIRRSKLAGGSSNSKPLALISHLFAALTALRLGRKKKIIPGAPPPEENGFLEANGGFVPRTPPPKEQNSNSYVAIIDV